MLVCLGRRAVYNSNTVYSNSSGGFVQLEPPRAVSSTGPPLERTERTRGADRDEIHDAIPTAHATRGVPQPDRLATTTQASRSGVQASQGMTSLHVLSTQ